MIDTEKPVTQQDLAEELSNEHRAQSDSSSENYTSLGYCVQDDGLYPVKEKTFECIVDLDRTYSDHDEAQRDMPAIIARLKDPRNRLTLTTSQLGKYIEEGHAFLPSICINGVKQENWQSQQVFCVDVDNDDAYLAQHGLQALDPVVAMDRCQTLGIWPDILYPTLSDGVSVNRRFRLVWIEDKPVMDRGYAHRLLDALLKEFPEADQACRNLNRVWFGAGGSVYYPCRFSPENARS